MNTLKGIIRLILVLISSTSSCANYVLKPLSYTRLPSTPQPMETFRMFGGTAEEAAYDSGSEMLYIIGEESRLLHIIDVSNPSSPTIAATHVFTTSDGKPRDVAVCGFEVAIAVTSPIKDVYEGHVYFYRTLVRGETQLKFDRKVTVGAFPDMLTFTPDCSKILVANEGRPGLDMAKQFTDPTGTVTIIQKNGFSEQTVDFSKGDGQWGLRRPSYYVPPNLWPQPSQPTFAQDAEPEYITVSSDGKTAFVILQKNNAIATLDIENAEIKSIGAIPNKEWVAEGIDPSDRDGGPHLRKFPLYSIKQPDNTRILRIGTTDYLVTADEGHFMTYTRRDHGFDWSDHQRADALIRAKKFDEVSINNQSFISHLTSDTKAGRLQVSQTEGYNPFSQKLMRVSHFGGRGFSIWNSKSFSLVYDSKDEIEKKTALFYPDVFNTDCLSTTMTYQSPNNLRDTTSDDMGPKLNALDVVTDNNVTYLLTGSETSGVLFLYTVDTTPGYPLPKFESAHRAGLPDYVWSELYEMNEAGDVGISAIGIIKSSDHRSGKTMAYVVGGISGTVSLYEILDISSKDVNTP